ncbi:prepilin peptidase [Bradyrhizobium sp. Arg314]
MSEHGWLLLGSTLALATMLVAISVIDFRRMMIPDGLNVVLAAGGLGFQMVVQPDALPLQAGYAVTILAAFWAIRRGHFARTGRIGLGLGDVKMLGAAACWIDPLLFPLLLFVASAAALLFVGWQAVAIGPATVRSRVPFGPFIALGLACGWALEHFVGLNLEML